MTNLLIFILCLTLSGCITQPQSLVVPQRGDLIQIARGEIDRRHIHLPSDCAVTIHEGVTVSPVDKAREEYFVNFTFAHGGQRGVIYRVVIDKRSGKVDDFLDYRDTIPGGSTVGVSP
ncbi:MAG TPA: hypothetical protein VM940_11575 [Chthoniobacterales bacterium]|jgi:hypothetical protein|nr:hypothetical protein [Chthoniobacterales bacterium]